MKCWGQNWNGIEKELMSEEEKVRCCSEKLTCCKKTEDSTNFEVRALLIKCPPPSSNLTYAYTKRHTKSTKYGRSINENCQIINCKKKLKLTIKIKNTGPTNCKSQYILIDHVFDEDSGQKHKLLYPYALRLKQEPIMQMYTLNFESMVNAQAKEKVFNKMDSGE